MKPFNKLIIIAIFLLSFCSFSKTITVDNKVGSVAMFVSLQEACDFADAEDTILIAGSPHRYYAGISKKLHFVGPGYFLLENGIPGITKNFAECSITIHTISTETFFSTGSGSTFTGLTGMFTVYPGTDSFVPSAIFNQCSGRFGTGGNSAIMIINRCWIQGFEGEKFAAGSVIRNSYMTQGFYAEPGVTIENSIIYTNTIRSSPESSISNCIFVFTGSGPAAGNLKGSVTYCLSAGGLSMAGQPTFLPDGVGNIPVIAFINDVFLEGQVAESVWRLKPGSPAIGAGLNGVDMGMFGGARPYVLSGVPSLPRITHFVSPSTATSSSGLVFEVHAESF